MAHAKWASICKERIVDLEFRISRLGILGKAYYELAQIKLKRHRAQISIARTQNLLLHAALDTLREKDRIARKNAGDLENLRKTRANLRVNYDLQRNEVFKRQIKLEWQITGTHSFELACAGVLDPNTPPDIRIRSLEHKLAWMTAKAQDMQILVTQYEGTVKVLRDDWTLYDSKLAAVQCTVTMKNRECELLINTHHDAIRARDAAKIELEELLAYIFRYGKKGLISPELRAKILRAIKEIKVVMDVGSMREMYHQFILQEKQSSYLESILEEMRKMAKLMKADYQTVKKRRSSKMETEDVARIVDGTTMLVRRQSSMSAAAMKNSFPLLKILEGTQKLVDKLHEGHLTMSDHKSIERQVLNQCEERLVLVLQALHRQLKRVNKQAIKKAEFEAKQAAHWQKEEAAIARRHKAAEEARKKYEEREAAREASREAAREEAEKELSQQKDKVCQISNIQEAPEDMVVPDPSQSQTTTDDLSSSSGGNEYMLSSFYQQAKQAEGAGPASTVIFLPTFQRRIVTPKGGIATESPDPTETSPTNESGTPLARPAEESISFVLSSDDEGPDESERHIKVALASHATQEPVEALTSTSPVTPPPIVIPLKSGRPTTVALSIEGDVEKHTSGSASSTDAPPYLKIKVSVTSIESFAAEPGAPTLDPESSEPTPPPKVVEGGPHKLVALSSEEISGAGKAIEGPSAESPRSTPAAAPVLGGSPPSREEGKSPLGTAVAQPIDQISTIAKAVTETAPSAEGSPIAVPKSAGTAVVSSIDEKRKELEEAKPASPESGPAGSAAKAAAESPATVELRVVELTLTDKSSVAKGTAEAIATLSREIVSPATVAALSITTDVRAAGRPTTVAAIPGGESVAPTAGELPPLPVPLIDVGKVAIANPAGTPSSTVSTPAVVGVPSADHPPQTPAEAGVLASEGPPAGAKSPTVEFKEGAEIPVAVGVPPPSSSGVRVVRGPLTAEARLPRSPSGAPISSGAKIPPIETVSTDESLSQKSAGFRSPNLPRSPSGAPVATAVRFPLEPLSPSTRDVSTPDSVAPSGASSSTTPLPPPSVPTDTGAATVVSVIASSEKCDQQKQGVEDPGDLPSTSSGAPEAKLPAVESTSSSLPEQKVIPEAGAPER